MGTTIFYFSASGNSLAAARRIAAGLGDADVVSMAGALKHGYACDSDRVGFVFPVIAFGPPRTVYEFVETFEPRPGQYRFAVATCGGVAAGTIPLLRDALRRRGAELDAGFVVKAASNCMTLSPENCMLKMMTWLRGPVEPRPIGERAAEIVGTVRERRPHGPEADPRLARTLGSLIHKMAIKTFKNADKRYRADGRCTRCGTCEKVCPRGNIRVGEDGPVWNHDCQLCNACINWCPRGAIEYEEASAGRPRYHNPEASLKDLAAARG